MSYSNHQRSFLGRNASSLTGGSPRFQSDTRNLRFQSNSFAVDNNAPQRTPVLYSHQFVIRNQLPESEPMSECSEAPMGVGRLPSTPIHQMMPRPGPAQQQTRSGHYSRQSMPPSSPRLLPPPTPQFIPNYNPGSSTSTPRLSVQGFSMKKTDSGFKKTPSKPKISSVSRQRFVVGSIDQVVRWHKMAKEAQLYIIYEVVAVLDNVFLNPKGAYNIILRSEQKNSTLPLQAIFYPIDRDLPKVKIGQLVTCVGRMVGMNKLHVFNMWPVTESLAGHKRISFLCQRTLQEIHSTATDP